MLLSSMATTEFTPLALCTRIAEPLWQPFKALFNFTSRTATWLSSPDAFPIENADQIWGAFANSIGRPIYDDVPDGYARCVLNQYDRGDCLSRGDARGVRHDVAGA